MLVGLMVIIMAGCLLFSMVVVFGLFFTNPWLLGVYAVIGVLMVARYRHNERRRAAIRRANEAKMATILEDHRRADAIRDQAIAYERARRATDPSYTPPSSTVTPWDLTKPNPPTPEINQWLW